MPGLDCQLYDVTIQEPSRSMHRSCSRSSTFLNRFLQHAATRDEVLHAANANT